MIPTILPIFPLPNIVLFPHTFMPLHIFEPRYREMLKDIVSSHGTFVITQIKDASVSEGNSNSNYYPIGCMVRIVRADPLPDGCWNILVHGMALVDIKETLDGKLYRQAYTSPRIFQDEKGLTAEQRITLQNRFMDYVIQLNTEDDLKSEIQELLESGLKDEVLLNTIALSMRIDPVERQFLLEAQSVQDLYNRIYQLWDFVSNDRNTPEGGQWWPL